MEVVRDFLISWKIGRDRRDRKIVVEWVRDEWERYATAKNAEELGTKDRMMHEGGVGPGSEWNDLVNQYLKRASVFGLDTPKGRQQAMKSATTLLDMLACMVRVYGEPPEPGEAS